MAAVGWLAMMAEDYDAAEAYRAALVVQNLHAATGWCLNCTATGCRMVSWAVETIAMVSAERERKRLAAIQEAR